jgi:hypothetical protein
MAIETVVAGAYHGVYNAVDVGYTQNGFEVQFDSFAEEVNETDAYGQTLIDLVYRGGTHYILYESKVFKAGSVTPFWPWGTGLGVLVTPTGPIGRLGSLAAAPFVMTVTPATPADAPTALIDTLTASKAILAPNSNLRLLFTSKVRTVPTRLVCLPTETAGIVTAFSVASA